MPRTKGSLNKDKTQYLVRVTNILDDSKCEKQFSNIAEIVSFLCDKGMDVSEKTIYRYISKGGPSFLEVLKI
jgi:hypothetical protein